MLSLLFAAWMAAPALASTDQQMRFRYVPNEGAEAAACTHQRIRDLPDWDVRCQTEGGPRRFTAHVVVEARGPTLTEVLYWVTSSEQNRPRFQGTTFLFRTKDKTHATGIVMAQSVENDYASLQLEWKAL